MRENSPLLTLNTCNAAKSIIRKREKYSEKRHQAPGQYKMVVHSTSADLFNQPERLFSGEIVACSLGLLAFRNEAKQVADTRGAILGTWGGSSTRRTRQSFEIRACINSLRRIMWNMFSCPTSSIYSVVSEVEILLLARTTGDRIFPLR